MILMACFEVPGYGGAATANYQRYASLRRAGLDVTWLSLVPVEREAFIRATFGPAPVNPLGLDGVSECPVAFPPFGTQAELRARVAELGPQLLVGCSFISALLLHRCAPDLPLVFLTAGFPWVRDLVAQGRFPDAATLLAHLEREGPDSLPPLPRSQREAYLASRCCVTHAPMIKRLYEVHFPDRTDHLHPEVVWMQDLAQDEARAFQAHRRPFSERDLDLLFVASHWSRPEKNFALVEALARACPDLRIGLSGDCERVPPGVTVVAPLGSPREEVLGVMGRARALVCPSSFDPAPGVLYEAEAMGCNLVASRNCGNWMVCPPELVVESYSLEAFHARCRLAVERPYPARSLGETRAGLAILLQEVARAGRRPLSHAG